MGWIHAGTGGAGPYVMDDPLYAARHILKLEFEKAVRQLFRTQGIVVPQFPEEHKTTWFSIFVFGGEFFTIPETKKLKEVLAGTLEVYAGKKTWRRMDPLAEKHRLGLEWILPRLEKLRQKFAESGAMDSPERIHVLAQEIATMAQ